MSETGNFEIAEHSLVEAADRAKPLILELEHRQVAELLAMQGMDVKRVSEVTGIPISAIKRWKKHPDFIKYQNDFVLELAKDMRAFHLSMCYKVLNARMDKIEDIGDWSLFSGKDSIDIMDFMRKAAEKPDEKEQSTYIKTIEAILSKSKKELPDKSSGGS